MVRTPGIRGTSAITTRLRQIGDRPGVPALVSAALTTLRALVPADHASYNETDAHGARTLVEPRGADDFPGAEEAFARHFRRHPFLVHVDRISDGRVWCLSELVSRRHFHRLGIYGEYYRHLGVEYQLAIALDATRSRAVGFVLSRGAPDFSSREERLIQALGPHLREAYRTALALEAVGTQYEVVEGVLTTLDVGLVELAADATLEATSPTIARWVAEYFGADVGTGARLPDALTRWLRASESRSRDGVLSPPLPPLVVEGPSGRLEIRLAERADRRVLVLRERRRGLRADVARRLGLTPREAQILALVAAGHSNAQIGLSLGTSPRTIGKHLEAVYRKLDVDSRTAAAARLQMLADEAPGSPGVV
jgi:DNA-binding CsgD family transcriptional regulator